MSILNRLFRARLIKSVCAGVTFFLLLFAHPTQAQLPPEGRTLYTLDSEVLVRLPLAEALNVDVLWCAGDEQAESRRLAAAESAAAIATFARIHNSSIAA